MFFLSYIALFKALIIFFKILIINYLLIYTIKTDISDGDTPEIREA